MATLRETIDFYVERLALQYRGKPKARATIAIYVKQMLADMLPIAIRDAFDVDTAVGNQLDVLGKYIGVRRMIGDPIPRPFFSFSTSDGVIRPNGFRVSTNGSVNAQAIWYQSRFLGTSNTALSDVAYKLVLQLQIILNANDGTLASIQEYLHTFLPGLVALTDNANMTLTYTLTSRSPVSSNVLKQFLPKPMGVGIIFNFLMGGLSQNAIAKTVTTASPFVTVTTDTPVSVTVDNGVAPYSYNWERISGSALIIPVDALASSTKFTMLLVPNPTNVTAVYRCTVTDSRGIVGYSDTVSVHLVLQTPP